MSDHSLDRSLRQARGMEMADLPFGFTDDVMLDIQQERMHARLTGAFILSAAVASVVVAVVFSLLLLQGGQRVNQPPPLTLFQSEILTLPTGTN